MKQMLEIRQATREDLSAIVNLLANDELGMTRERISDPLPPSYLAAFEAISKDENNLLIVGQLGSQVSAVLQLTLIPNLTYLGRWRAQIEGVRVAQSSRGSGFGKRLILHAIEIAKDRNCCIVQLTTDKRRSSALEFYERLGFKATHEGLKIWL